MDNPALEIRPNERFLRLVYLFNLVVLVIYPSIFLIFPSILLIAAFIDRNLSIFGGHIWPFLLAVCLMAVMIVHGRSNMRFLSRMIHSREPLIVVSDNVGLVVRDPISSQVYSIAWSELRSASIRKARFTRPVIALFTNSSACAYTNCKDPLIKAVHLLVERLQRGASLHIYQFGNEITDSGVSLEELFTAISSRVSA